MNWQFFLNNEADSHGLSSIQRETLLAMYPDVYSNLTITEICKKLHIAKSSYDDEYRSGGIYEKFEEECQDLKDLKSNKGKKDKYPRGKLGALHAHLRKKFLKIDNLWQILQEKAEKFKMGPVKASVDQGLASSYIFSELPPEQQIFPKEINIGDPIKIQINSEKKTCYLLLLEKGTDNNYWRLCPSVIASHSFQNNTPIILPQEKLKAIPMKFYGNIEHIAILTENPPQLNWENYDDQPFLHLLTQHLLELLNYLEKTRNYQILRHEFKVI